MEAEEKNTHQRVVYRAKSIIERADIGALRCFCEQHPQVLSLRTSGIYEPTLLHLAAVKAKLSMVNYLISKGAKVDATDANGETALCWCVTIFNKRTIDTAWALKKAEADVNHRDSQGRVAVILAAVRGTNDETRRRRVELCIALGMDPRVRDDAGKRAIDYVGETTDGGSLVRMLPDSRLEVERARQLLRREMDRRDVKLLVLLMRRRLYGNEWAIPTSLSSREGGGDTSSASKVMVASSSPPPRAADVRYQTPKRKRGRKAAVVVGSIARHEEALLSSTPVTTPSCYCSAVVFGLQDKDLFRHVMAFL